MVLAMPTRKEMGERVEKVWQLSGLSATAFGNELRKLIPELEKENRNLKRLLCAGKGRVAERRPAIAEVVAGKGLLKDKTAEEILRYLNFEIDSLDLRVNSPPNEWNRTPIRVLAQEPLESPRNVTAGVRAS